MTDTAEQIKKQLSWSDIVRTEGNKAYCDIHGDEKTPDMDLFDDGGSICHACRGKGKEPYGFRDFIDYIAHRDFNGQYGEAIQHLINEYNLDIEYSEDEDVEPSDANKEIQRVYNCLSNVVEKAQENMDIADYQRLKESRGWRKETIQDLKIGKLDVELFNDLQDRWEDTLEKAGIHYRMTGDHADINGLYLIPHLKRTGEILSATGMVAKQDRNKLDPSEGDSKYEQHKKTEYVQNRLYTAADNNSDTLILTEGYPDAISAYQEGFDVVAAGCGTFKGSFDFLRNFADKYYDQVVVVTDNDDTGKENLEETAKELSKKAFTKIFRFSEDREEGYDLDDYTSEEGDIQNLVEDSTEYIQELRSIYKDANRKERQKAKEILFEIFSYLQEIGRSHEVTEIISDFSSRETISKSDLKADFENWSEANEADEEDEAGRDDSDNSGGGGVGEWSWEQLSEYEPEKKIRLRGKTKDRNFLVIWVEKKNHEIPLLITDKGEIEEIKFKLDELPDDIVDEMDEEEKERHMYNFVELDGSEIIFDSEVPTESKNSLNNLDNRFLKYVTGKEIAPQEEELFDKATDLIRDYWVHYHDEWYDISAAYAIHSYLIHQLGYTTYVLLEGLPDTGKTTWQKVIAELCYNGFFASNTTAAAAVRYANSWGATIHQDEMERVSEEEKTKLQGLYNSGQRKGSAYNTARNDPVKVEDQVQEIRSFSAKTMSVNDSFDFAESFLSRSVVLKTVKAGEEVLDLESRPKKEDKRFREIQAQLAYYTLQNADEIIKEIEEAKNNLEETGRQSDKLSVFAGIVNHFKGEERAEEILDRIRDSQRLQDTDDIGKRPLILFEEITDRFSTAEKPALAVKLSDLAEAVNQELGFDRDDDFAASSKSVASTLGDYDIIRSDDQKKRKSDGTYVEIYRPEFVDSLDRYGLAGLRDDVMKTMPDQKEEKSDLPASSSSSGSSDSSNEVDSRRSGKIRPSNSQIKDAIENLQEKYEKGVPISEVEDFFEEKLGEDKVAGDQFSKENRNTGLGKLLKDGEILEPVSGRVQVM